MQRLTDTRLMLILVNEGYGRAVVEAMRAAGAPGCTKVRGTSDTFFTESVYGTRDHDILLCFIRDGLEEVSAAVNTVAVCDPRIQVISLLTGKPLADATNNDDSGAKGSVSMGQAMTLIVVIVSHGHTEGLMSAARDAGARGGTVVKARGTGTEEDATFFGISLAPEKEMLYILADSDNCQSIINAIHAQPILNEPGGGIVFTMEVERAVRHNC